MDLLFGQNIVRKLWKMLISFFPIFLKMSSLNVLFCPQLSDIQFTVTEEERKQIIFTFNKLESKNPEVAFL